MESNSGKPKTWGASIEEEVMALDNIKDRAYKMSNELLGAYDQVSETGKELRDMLIPFHSWMEVNMKRYYRLLKNGFNGKNNTDFTRRLLMGKAAGIPFYALSAVDSLGKIALFTAAIQLFNRLVWSDADDELPENVKYLPHITLGKSSKGDIYYFDRIGAAADILDWGALDSIVPDVRDMLNGQLSLGGWVKKILQAPVNKVINGLNPMLKMPIELAMGRSMYPDVFHSQTIITRSLTGSSNKNNQNTASAFSGAVYFYAVTAFFRIFKASLTSFIISSISRPSFTAFFAFLTTVFQ